MEPKSFNHCHLFTSNALPLFVNSHLLHRENTQNNFSRQIFLFTDGCVSNASNCIEIVRKNAKTTRLFTFGIGNGVSTSLVKGLAYAGKGFSEFIVSESSEKSLELVTLRQMNR